MNPPTEKDLDERINLNLKKDKLTLEQIKEDTENLIHNFQWTIIRCTCQIGIYNDLLKRIEEKIKERDNVQLCHRDIHDKDK